MSKIFTFYADPGHAWLKVSIKDIHDVNLSVQQISQYSYFKGDFFYLEEDADASLFFAAYRAKYGVYPANKGSHSKSSSRIRSYPRWSGIDASFERQNELVKYFNGQFAKNFPQAA